jgi:UDP-N-acetylmuramoylalanine-D-glutamate ligase
VIEKKVPAIAFFKPSGQTMYDLLRERYPKERWPEMRVIETMEEAVRFAYEHAPHGGVVLLSPSSPSFGQFKNYEDKSAQFRHWIEQLSENYRD